MLDQVLFYTYSTLFASTWSVYVNVIFSRLLLNFCPCSSALMGHDHFCLFLFTHWLFAYLGPHISHCPLWSITFVSRACLSANPLLFVYVNLDFDSCLVSWFAAWPRVLSPVYAPASRFGVFLQMFVLINCSTALASFQPPCMQQNAAPCGHKPLVACSLVKDIMTECR